MRAPPPGRYEYSVTELVLTTPRLRLLPATPTLLQADLEGPTHLAAALAVSVPADWPPPLTGEEALQHTLRALAHEPAGSPWHSWYFSLWGEGGATVVGTGGFKGPPAEGAVEVGYSVVESVQGRGLATEAVGALIAWAFTHPEVERVVAHTLPELRASRRVLVKLGFRLARVLVEDGQDVLAYELHRGA